MVIPIEQAAAMLLLAEEDNLKVVHCKDIVFVAQNTFVDGSFTKSECHPVDKKKYPDWTCYAQSRNYGADYHHSCFKKNDPSGYAAVFYCTCKFGPQTITKTNPPEKVSYNYYVLQQGEDVGLTKCKECMKHR